MHPKFLKSKEGFGVGRKIPQNQIKVEIQIVHIGRDKFSRINKRAVRLFGTPE